jgi:aquaporin Z
MPGGGIPADGALPARWQELVMYKLSAEFLGTLILVLFGCGAAVLGGESVGQLGIAIAFGLAIVAGAYSLGPTSGGHFNPAVSLAAFIAHRISSLELVGYWLAQFLGGVAGALTLMALAGGTSDGLGQNGWGPGFLGGYMLGSALVFETVMTALFVIVILGATRHVSPSPAAGLAIGLTLTAIHIVGIQITGVSVNPARSFGPALLVGGKALEQVWLFFVAPLLGAAIGAWIYTHLLVPRIAPDLAAHRRAAAI